MATPAQVDRTYSMKAKLILTLIVGIASVALSSKTSAFSWNDDSHYVPLDQQSGYYIVRPYSQLFRKLDLYDAPYIDTADPLRHGYGEDALAFRFSRNGVLIAPPAYIAQESPSDFYTQRIRSLIRGRTTVHQVEALFGHEHNVATHPDGFTVYYALPVYSPFEEALSGGDH